MSPFFKMLINHTDCIFCFVFQVKMQFPVRQSLGVEQ